MVVEPLKAVVKRRSVTAIRTSMGRGLSRAELKDVGMFVGEARKLGLMVDERRSLKHEENVGMLKEWLRGFRMLSVHRAATSMSFGRYVPWRRIGAWSCLGCGGCCTHFRVVLRPYEYALLTEVYGHGIIRIDSMGSPCLKRVGNKCIFQDNYGLCALQPLRMKPLACKVWPFAVCSEPKRKHENGEALFVYKGRDYYVHIDMSYPCRGIGAGTREKLHSTIAEVIELQQNPANPQIHSTSTSTLSPVSRIPLIGQVVRAV